MFGLKKWQRNRLLHQVHHVITQAFAGPVAWTDLAVCRQIARDTDFIERALNEKKLESYFPSVPHKTILFTRYLTDVVLRGDLFCSIACPESVVCAVSTHAVDRAAEAFYRSATRVTCWFPDAGASQKYFPEIPSLAVPLPELDVMTATLCPDRRVVLLDSMQSFARSVPERHIPALKCCLDALVASAK